MNIEYDTANFKFRNHSNDTCFDGGDPKSSDSGNVGLDGDNDKFESNLLVPGGDHVMPNDSPVDPNDEPKYDGSNHHHHRSHFSSTAAADDENLQPVISKGLGQEDQSGTDAVPRPLGKQLAFRRPFVAEPF